METERGSGTAGFTLIEIIVVLAVVAALAAILTPMVVRYVEDANVSRAQADTKVIGSAVAQFYRDVGVGPVYDSNTDYQSRNAEVEVLYSAGQSPALGGGATGWPDTGGGVFDETATAADAIGDQLIANTDGTSAIYPTSSPAGVRPGQGSFWQGPYLETVGSDPWGQRYLVSVRGFGVAPGEAAFAISAGENGQIETSADQARAAELTVGGDDILFRVR